MSLQGTSIDSSSVASKWAKQLTSIFNTALLLALLLWPVEILLATLCPTVQIFGRNDWRSRIAETLQPILGVSAWHTAGALTDFKKLAIYVPCALQLLLTKSLLLAPNDLRGFFRKLTPEDGQRLLLTPRTYFVGYRRLLAVAAGGLLGSIVIIIGVIVYATLWLPPAPVDHVFGPVGKGLISSFFHPDLSFDGHLALVVYRSWYLLLLFPIMVVSGYSILISLLRAAELRPRGESVDVGLDAWTIVFSGIPFLMLAGLLLLADLSRERGIGELNELTTEVVSLGAYFSATWLVLSVVILAAALRPSPDTAPAIIKVVAHLIAVFITLLGLMSIWQKGDLVRISCSVAAAIAHIVAFLMLYNTRRPRLQRIGRRTILTVTALSGAIFLCKLAITKAGDASAVLTAPSPEARTNARRSAVANCLGEILEYRMKSAARVEAGIESILSENTDSSHAHDAWDYTVYEALQRIDCNDQETKRYGATYDPSALRSNRCNAITKLRAHFESKKLQYTDEELMPNEVSITRVREFIELEIRRFDEGCKDDLLGLTSSRLVRSIVILFAVGAILWSRWNSRGRLAARS